MNNTAKVAQVSFLILILIIALAYAPIVQPHRSAFAQQSDVKIETSADTHGGRFFGEAVLQVLITDENAANDGTVGTLTVNIDAKSDTGTSSSHSVTVPETTESSGMFEFFLVHKDATAVEPSDLDPVNSAGVEGDGTCVTNCAPFVRFGPGAEIDIDSALYQDARFEFIAHETHAVINYEETAGEISLDRDSYGSNSFVYIFVSDQDANLNPFERDEFIVNSDTGPNKDLFDLGGGNFIGGDITFQETGDNTGVFRGKYQLGASIQAVTKSLVLTLHDKANYNGDLEAPENDSNVTDEVSFTIGDNSGSVTGTGGQQLITEDAKISSNRSAYAIGERVEVIVEDNDANINPDIADSIQLNISSSSDQITLLAQETGQDTQIFVADFLIASNMTDLPVQDRDAAIGVSQVEDVVMINYIDQRPADYSEKLAAGLDPEKVFTLSINVHAIRVGIDSTSLTTPSLKDIGGNSINAIPVGRQAILSTTITNNNNDQTQPFVAIIEVRDSEGITVYLSWQSGSLDPDDKANVGLSWTPETQGSYQVRAFAISNLSNGEILSQLVSSQVAVLTA